MNADLSMLGTGSYQEEEKHNEERIPSLRGKKKSTRVVEQDISFDSDLVTSQNRSFLMGSDFSRSKIASEQASKSQERPKVAHGSMSRRRNTQSKVVQLESIDHLK